MKINIEQTNRLYECTRQHYVEYYDLQTELVDHLANAIEQKWLDELAEDESVIVFTETTSNIHHPDFFASIDKIIAPLTDKEFKDLQPEILITFGGMIVSKKIKQYI